MSPAGIDKIAKFLKIRFWKALWKRGRENIGDTQKKSLERDPHLRSPFNFLSHFFCPFSLSATARKKLFAPFFHPFKRPFSTLNCLVFIFQNSWKIYSKNPVENLINFSVKLTEHFMCKIAKFSTCISRLWRIFSGLDTWTWPSKPKNFSRRFSRKCSWP